MGGRARIWLVRAALVGAAAGLAAVAHAERAPVHHEHPPAQLNGRTREGIAIWALERRGRLVAFRAVWRGGCFNAGGSSYATLRRHELEHAGRNFAGSISYRGWRYRGWVPHLTTRLSGLLAEGGRSADGVLDGTVTWMRNGRRGKSCDTGPIAWHLAAP